MVLYWLEHDTPKKYQYAYKDVSLIGYNRSVCPRCNRQVATPHYKGEASHLILEGGSVYPDHLQFCGAGKQLFLISEKVLNAFEDNGITGYSGYQAVTSESIDQSNASPIYYSLKISGRIDLNATAMHIKKKRVCPQCNQFEWSRMRMEPIILDPTTWDGSDLCLVSSITGFRVCTEKVRNVIQKNKLLGFSFRAAL